MPASTSGNFDLAVVADCDDVAGYRAYATHPAHLAVIAERIRPILADRAAVQYEVAAHRADAQSLGAAGSVVGCHNRNRLLAEDRWSTSRG